MLTLISMLLYINKAAQGWRAHTDSSPLTSSAVAENPPNLSRLGKQTSSSLSMASGLSGNGNAAPSSTSGGTDNKEEDSPDSSPHYPLKPLIQRHDFLECFVRQPRCPTSPSPCLLPVMLVGRRRAELRVSSASLQTVRKAAYRAVKTYIYTCTCSRPHLYDC